MIAVTAKTCAWPDCKNSARQTGAYCSEKCRRKASNRRIAEKRRAARSRRAPALPIPELPSLEEAEKAELRAALRRSQASLARAKAKTEDLVESVYRAAKDAAVLLGPVVIIPPPSIVKATQHVEVALIHTTDWQLGKLTKSYSMAKCEERLGRLADKIAILTAIQRAEHPVKHAVVMFGGDIVENLNIFPGQAYEVEAGLYEQMFRAVKIGIEFLRRMLAIFETVEVIAEEGNHGRLMKRGDFPRTDNADMMVYEIIRQGLAGETRLTWQPRVSFYQPVTIGNYKAILIHGDEIKSFGGNTPAYGILRKMTSWASGVIPGGFTDAYMGHYHTPLELTLPNGGQIFGTGSMESDSVYAQEFVAAKGSPTQRLHYIDPRKGRVTCRYTVHVDDDE